MFTLGYRLDPVYAAKASEVDLASADATSLRYHLFPGDIIMEGEHVDFSARWGWVQVLDFALSLAAILATLEDHSEARFEFTESDAALDFRMEGEEVCISSTYAPGLLRVSVSEFRDQVTQLVQRVFDDLCGRYRHLALNPEIIRHLGR